MGCAASSSVSAFASEHLTAERLEDRRAFHRIPPLERSAVRLLTLLTNVLAFGVSPKREFLPWDILAETISYMEVLLIAPPVQFFLVGGQGSIEMRGVERFERRGPKIVEWNTVTLLREARRQHAVVSFGGAIYALGGCDGGTSPWSIHRSVERYDPISGMQSDAAPMGVHRCRFGCAVLKGQIYAVGGRGWDGVPDIAVLATVEKYDPNINEWRFLRSMHSPRMGHGVAVLGGYLFAVGGFIEEGYDSEGDIWSKVVRDTVERYDPTTGAWTLVASLLTPRGDLTVGVLDGVLYAVGGRTDGQQQVSETEGYDMIRQNWIRVAPLREPRSAHAIVAHAGCLYVLGGTLRGPALRCTVERFYPNGLPERFTLPVWGGPFTPQTSPSTHSMWTDPGPDLSAMASGRCYFGAVAYHM